MVKIIGFLIALQVGSRYFDILHYAFRYELQR